MNMNAKKRVNGSWVNTTLRQYKTATDTITTFPAVLYTTGTTATVVLKGQAVQSGTPTPDSPIMPQGTGDKTENLFDKTTLENGIYLALNGNKYGYVTNGVRAGVKIKVLPNTAYTLSAQSSADVSLRILEWSNGTFTTQKPKYNISGNISLTVTTDAETTEIAFNIEGANGQYVTNIMLNSGSEALPYEPYGYKIPISSANTTTLVYLGEVETTRRIKKLVLNSKENWKEGTSNYYILVNVSGKGNGIPNSTALSTHTESGVVVNNKGTALFFKKSVFVHSSLADFKTYLAQQYAAGTPVTVWYVLATPETGIINEPLMKIGNYADEVSNILIPTITGKNIVDVETVLKPSEVSFNYAGWHTAVVHKRINGAWD